MDQQGTALSRSHRLRNRAVINMKKYIVGFAFLLILTCIITALSGLYPEFMPYKPSVADVSGEYSSDNSPVKWSLSLGRNGTYHEVIYRSDGVKMKNSGKWELERPADEIHPQVILVNVLMYPDDPSVGAAKGDWEFEIQPTFSGRPRLVIEDDLGIYFTKIR